MSSTSIRISDELARVSREESEIMQRSLGGQVEYWARIGRAIEHSGQFDYQHIARALSGQFPIDDLSPYEKPVYDALHEQAMRVPGKGESEAQQRRLREMEKAGVDINSLGD